MIYRPEIWALMIRRILETTTELKLYLTDPRTVLDKNTTLTKKIEKSFGENCKKVFESLSNIIHGLCLRS